MTMLETQAISDAIAGCVSSATLIRRDEPMAKHTTLRVGGPADVYVEPANENDLAAILKYCRSQGVNFFMLGRGSNLLVRDRGYRGVVICLSQPEFSKMEIDDCRLRCGAGVRLKQVAVEARRKGICGMEFLEGIPGSVGGALRMNAGAMGGAMFDVVETVRVMGFDGNIHNLLPRDMAVAYRGCATLKEYVALGAVLCGRPDSVESIAQRMSSYSQKRWSSQPAAPSAGCMFKNPPTIPAGRLIDELGLKGTRVGGARISDEHGNFLVNDGNATAAEVLELMRLLQARARAERGIELHTEVEIIGE